MLANPVVIHSYDPLIWPICVVAMWAEIGTEVALLRPARAAEANARAAALATVDDERLRAARDACIRVLRDWAAGASAAAKQSVR